MLELKFYTKAEMTALFGTRGMQGLQRKMRGYGITFEVLGRGESAVFKIQEIESPFKIYCITELGFDGHTDFRKLRNYYYYYFNDAEFRAMPNEVQEHRLRLIHRDVSRQTIANYLEKLHARNIIQKNSGNYVYYFAHEDTQRIVNKEEYTEAWKQYWEDIGNGCSSKDAIYNMIRNYNGVARKQEIPDVNGVYNEEAEKLCNYIQQDILKELE